MNYSKIGFRAWIWIILLAAVLPLPGGCQSQDKPKSVSEPVAGRKAAPESPEQINQIDAADPCATQIHDVCGPLLLYYAKNQKLPDKLEELQALPGGKSLSLTCPISQKRYIYVPAGLQVVNQPGLVILCDPEPSHHGLRWAISISEPAPFQPLITRVIALSEEQYKTTAKVPSKPKNTSKSD
jgi:hypothetical protein